MGLFGVQVGSVTMGQVDKQIDRTSLAATLNSYFASGFGAQTTAAVAATLVKNLGITGAGVDGAVAYVTGALNAAAPAARGEAISNIINLFSGLTNDATYGAAAQAWNANVDVAAAYTGAANVAFGAVIQHNLTGGLDTLFGSALADMFTADLSNGGNTLQGGDRIDGGAGNDTLKAILGSMGEDKAITAQTSGIEKVIIQAQSRNSDTGDNNVSNEGIVNVDAARMSGVNNWENSNSRADLIVEDVRISDNQITKDITITMRETDPGHVDFAVYFDQNSLRNSSASTSQINLQVMDTRAVVDGKDPLLNSPYGGFKFTATDAKGVATVVTLQSDAIDAAQTYTQLVAAFQAAADKQFGAGAVTVSIGSDFTVTDTTTAKSVIGKEVVIKTSSSFSFTTPAGSGWVAAGVVPANSGLHTNFSQGSTKNTDPVTSTIVLDDVGRGSTGGDLVVGGLSVGETSTSKGVERFNITVEDNSKLETINSTNNTLREVSIVNGSTSRVDNAYNDNVKDAGNLTVTGTVVGPVADNNSNYGSDNRLPGLNTVEHGDYGFTDVKLIDASTFKGKLDLDAQLTDRVVAKYLTLTDAAPAAAAADNVSFDYLMGTNNDKFMLNIAKGNLDSYKGTTNREDLVVNIKGNEGNDTITTLVGDGTSISGYELTGKNTNAALIDGVPSKFENWYINSKLNANLNVDGGVGNDTINLNGGGDWKVTAGAGDDAVYANNMVVQNLVDGPDDDAFADAIVVGKAAKAKWVFNGSNTLSEQNDKNFMSGVKMSVTFKHITVTVDVPSTDGFTTDLQINQAIKQAINKDATLSKLLVAKDGQANSLVVESLIEGQMAGADLSLAFARPATVSGDAYSLLNGYRAAYKAAGIDLDTELGLLGAAADSTTDPQKVLAIMDASINALTNLSPTTPPAFGGTKLFANSQIGGYVKSFAAGQNSQGGAADHTLYLGTGNDVAALGTEGNSNDTLVYVAGEEFGNDTVVHFTKGTLVEIATVSGTGADKFDFTGLGGDMLSKIGSTSAANHVQAVNGLTGPAIGVNFFNYATSTVLNNVGAAGVGYATNSIANDTTSAGTPTFGVNRDLTAMPTIDAKTLMDRSISIMNLDQVWPSSSASVNDTAAKVAAWYEAGSSNTYATTHVLVVVDAHNVGTVYAVNDGTGTADATAKAMGTIDLADTEWSSLAWFNFA
ncbi:MAG: hypothetical protein CFE38_13465 [Comamonadaceae bacterium PBBC1]|nr:MAG: hypothetical protein CFE38_13465 [Comamonadaceae bacterium PBBC1]